MLSVTVSSTIPTATLPSWEKEYSVIALGGGREGWRDREIEGGKDGWTEGGEGGREGRNMIEVEGRKGRERKEGRERSVGKGGRGERRREKVEVRTYLVQFCFFATNYTKYQLGWLW